MAKTKQINLGEMAIAIALNTKALQDGLNEVKVHLRKNQKDIQASAKDYDVLAVAAGIAFYKIANAVKSGIQAYNESRSALVGLKSIAEGTGASFQKAQQYIQEYTNDGLIPASQAATALKNLLNRGYTETQAIDVLNRLKDSAAFGRQASLELGQAVASATEGLKNENSILVDNAGVTKNVSVMWKEYAETIGKSVNDLSKQQKIQAEYNGIMQETRFQVGDAAKLSKELAGAQARNAAETLKLKQAFGEAMAPALEAILTAITPIIKGIAEFAKNNKELVAGLTTSGVAFLGFATLLMTVVSAIAVLKPAIAALNLSFAGLLANPVVLTLTALVGVVTTVGIAVNNAKKQQETYNQVLKDYNRIVSEGISKTEVATLTEKIKDLKKLSKEYDDLKNKAKELSTSQLALMTILGNTPWLKMFTPSTEAGKLLSQLNAINKQMITLKPSYKSAEEAIKDYEYAIKEANRTTAKMANDRAVEIAQNKARILETQNLITVYQSAKVGSNEWRNAQKQLADQFPQFATAAGIKIDSIKKVTQAQQNAVNAEWKMLQTEIQISIIKIKDMIAVKNAALAAAGAEKAALEDARPHNTSKAWQEKFKEYKNAKEAVNSLNNELQILIELSKAQPEDVKGVTPADYGSSSSFKAYENKALESALKVHNHKVKMSQLSKEQELKDLEEIMKKFAKTADEKMDLEEQIYSVKQEILEKTKANNEAALKASEDALAQRTQASLNWIEDKKRLGQLDTEAEVKAYNAIITYHKEYLERILADEKISKEEKERIRLQELATIREYENKKFDIQQEYKDKQKNDTIDSINQLSDGVESALRARYEKEKALRENALEDELDSLEKWEKAYTDSIKTTYDLKIKSIKAAAEAQEKALKDEIDAIEQSQKAQNRSDADAAELKNINSLQNRIAYERDTYNKAELQKQLEQALADRAKRLNEIALEDKKDALSKQIDAVRDNADSQTEILEQQKEAELNRIQTLYEAEKISISNRKESWDNYYAQKLTAANLQAEAEKLIMQGNQNEILALIKSYGDEYKIAGQTLGEKLYEGFQPQIQAIKDIIASINTEINSARDRAISELNSIKSSTVTSGGTETNKKSTSTGTAIGAAVTQIVNFNQPIQSAAEAARKVAQVSKNLALEMG